ncbi:MAG TPA: SCP2 sterol-binding domain-containing protein [Burkholderiales bacterium]
MAGSSNPESPILKPAAAVNAAAASFINHLLRSASWARDALARHAGKTARFDVFPLVVAFTVLQNGEVAAAAAGAVPAATVKLSPGLMLRLAARDESAWREIDITGDIDFATAIHQVVRNLRWDVEEDLARVVGDIAAHRMVESGRTLQRWGEQAADNTARAFAEYWTEEQPLIAGARDLEAFGRDVDRLRDDAARLEKRIEQFARKSLTPAPLPSGEGER